MRLRWTEMSADNKGSTACTFPCLTMLTAAHACFSVKNNSALWMLMLSLNNKYFIGSIYAAMLWSLGDVTKPFHVNFLDVQKKNLYGLHLCRLFAGGSETKHECRGRDQIRFISAGAGWCGTEFCGSRTEKSVPHRSLDWSLKTKEIFFIKVKTLPR